MLKLISRTLTFFIATSYFFIIILMVLQNYSQIGIYLSKFLDISAKFFPCARRSYKYLHVYLYFENTRRWHACGEEVGDILQYFVKDDCIRIIMSPYILDLSQLRVRLRGRVGAHGISRGLSACVGCVTRRREHMWEHASR